LWVLEWWGAGVLRCWGAEVRWPMLR